MHQKTCSKLICSELRLDAAVQTSSQRGRPFVGQQGALRRPCSIGSVGGGRLPFSIISTNSDVVASAQLKPSSSSALQPNPVALGENGPLRFYQTTTEDAHAPLDVWTVIKPGHVREKIAIFASEGGADEAGDNEPMSASSQDGTPATNRADVSALPRATKAKGSWEENCSAKRRRRSGNDPNRNRQQDRRSQHLDTRQHSVQLSLSPSGWTRQLGLEPVNVVDEDNEQKVSVVEMVAFLEQRGSQQQPDCKPLLALQRSSTSITLSRALPPEVKGEEPESVRVSAMVAKLESECLRRKEEGYLSRSNSLRRTVGRVLLAADEDTSAPSQRTAPEKSSSSSGGEIRGSETPPALALATNPSAHPGELVDPITIHNEPHPPPPSEEAEPLPGLLFLCPHRPDLEHPPPPHRSTCEPQLLPCGGNSQSETRRQRKAGPSRGRAGPGLAAASHTFLETRQRLQQLLAPQPYLALLPHHLLVKIFLLLPTQSLAALKCTCHYFQFVIENYGVRPADSLWVSDPRYRDDPCKQCKKCYNRGDVSLCRWHHKPYCQALPYGPGYWMCCRGTHRDSPGCNVGLHDNRWVPPFHSINMPIYRRSCNDANNCV